MKWRRCLGVGFCWGVVVVMWDWRDLRTRREMGESWAVGVVVERLVSDVGAYFRSIGVGGFVLLSVLVWKEAGWKVSGSWLR